MRRAPVSVRRPRFVSAADERAARAFLSRSPVAEGLFLSLADFLVQHADGQWSASKSRVAFTARTRCIWIHEATREGIWLAFLHPKRLKAENLRSGPVGKRFAHHLKLTGAPRWPGRGGGPTQASP